MRTVKLNLTAITQICSMLIILGVIRKDKIGVFIINTMVVDLRNIKMKTESIII